MTPNRVRVLVVDDAVEHAEMVVEFIRVSGAFPGAELRVAGTYGQALEAFAAEPFDVALVDYGLDVSNGLALLRELREQGIDTPVIVLTGRGAEEVAGEAMRAGAADYLAKSQLSVEAIERSIRHALALRAEERQRRDAEAALRSSEERFRALVENSSDALVLLDRDARITYVTPSVIRQLGWKSEQLLGRSIFDIIHPEDVDAGRARFAETLRSPGRPVRAEPRVQHADGTWRIMDGIAVNRLDDRSVGAIVINARDVTERRRLEERLLQSQKMEAVGQLAGGVAHDFNNLLTAILGYCNLILEDLPPDAPLRGDLEEIRSAGERAAALTRQLLAFSRRQMLLPQLVDINSLVRELEKMLRRLISEDVEVVTRLAATEGRAHVDPSTIEQALINLALNARDAMPGGGRLVIETADVQFDEAYTGTHPPMNPGPYVLIAVSDTGHGMDAATSARVFEPFFTTKEQGRGSGLGLATVYGIVKQSGGYIWVYSEVGQGSVFKIYLPSAGAHADPGGTRAAFDPESARGSETVLLVEDEDAVRALTREVLERYGYSVLEARDGVEALDVAAQHPTDIHLIVTDVVMPRMSGRDLVVRLTADRPALKVLFMSGYTDHAAVHDDLTPGSAFLQKPFSPSAFARKVRSVLDARGDAQLSR